jgi:predicted metal-dependent HD superfamily phosphohydrolase
MPATRVPLIEEWRLDMEADGAVRANRAAVFEQIVARHSEPHRRYHGVTHLEALFELIRRHAPRVSPGCPSRLAIWWHDAIYDPQASDNEQRSADLARADLARLHVPTVIIDHTAALILMTKNHWRGPADGEGDNFLDADIAILGAPPETYDAYATGVRQEYSWADDAAYRTGRSTFLESALARVRLFRTETFEHAYAKQARENMARELASLTA